LALSCVYTDLDGTLLGKGASLFRSAEGSFSMAQARALEACARAEVEVVIMSGRREPQVHEAARLMGQTSYIYEAGCAFAIDDETTLLTGDLQPDESGTIYEQIEARGARSSSILRGRLSTTTRGTTAFSPPLRGKVDIGRATCTRHAAKTTCDCSTAARSLRGAVEGRTHAYHLVPALVSKANAAAAHARAAAAPGGVIAVGDSVGPRVAARSATSSSSPTGPARPACAPRWAPGTTPPSPGGRWAMASTRRSSRP
jgi:hypothetical protein